MRVNVEAGMFVWAIDRAGYQLSEFLNGKLPVADWINGSKKPTLKQLEAFAKKVRVPLGYLFLSNPPEEEQPIPFFRTDGNASDPISLNVYDTICTLQQRQDWLKAYLLDSDFSPLAYVGRYHASDRVETIVQGIREVLGLGEKWASTYPTWEKALKSLVEAIERQGIVVVFNGVVGNDTTRPIKVSECRGFVLVDDIAPFMFINNADSKTAQMFTLVHELAHIWVGKTAGFDFSTLQPADDPVEILCDQVAAEFLVPKRAFNDFWQHYPEFDKASKHFKVSKIVIARRALDTGKISRKEFFDYYETYKKRAEEKKQKQGGGGDFYATARARLSPTYALHVNNAVNSGQLLHREAYRLTGMKGDTFEKFFTKVI